MDWKSIISGVIIGAILGGAATFYNFNSRITKLETLFESNKTTNSSEIIIAKSTESTAKKKTFIFKESFDNNVLGWELEDNEKQKKYFKGGMLIIESKVGDQLTQSSVKIQRLPLKYTIQLNSSWLSGDENKHHGIIFFNDIDNFYIFGATSSGYAGVFLRKNTQWQPFIIFPKSVQSNLRNSPKVQIIKVDGNKFSYYLDGEFVGEGTLGEFTINYIGLFVDGIQTVQFDELSIFD